MFSENNPLGVSSIAGQFGYLRSEAIDWAARALFVEAHDGLSSDWWPGSGREPVNLFSKFEKLPVDAVNLWRGIAAVVLSACPEFAARACDDARHERVRIDAFVQRAKDECKKKAAAKPPQPIPLTNAQYRALELAGIINDETRHQFKKAYAYHELGDLCSDMSREFEAKNNGCAGCGQPMDNQDTCQKCVDTPAEENRGS